MRRRAAIVSVVLFLASFVFIGVALADDCSSPEDCANTAWTVGGAAAAVAVVVAAAVAGGWLPDEPQPSGGEGLSPECRERLGSALWDVHGAMSEIGELIVTREGAYRMAIDALGRAQSSSPGVVDVVPGSPMGKLDAVGKEVLENVYATGATAVEVASEAQKVALEARAEQFAALAARFRTEAGVAASMYSQKLTFDAIDAEGQALVGKFGGILLGTIDYAGTLWSQVTGIARLRELERMGRQMALAEQAREEAARWMDYGDSLTDGIAAKKADLRRTIESYNKAARECGAVPIRPPSYRDMTATMASTAQASAEGAGAGSAPASVLERGPAAIHERRDPESDCASARAAYDRDVSEFNRQKREWERHRTEFVRWEQRWKDGYHSYKTYKEQLLDAQARLRGEAAEWTAAGTVNLAVSGSTYLAGLLVALNPATAIGLGLVGMVASIRQGLKTPDEWNAITASYLDERLSWIQRRLGYATSESNRLRSFLEQGRQNMNTLGWRLRSEHSRCGGSGAWPAPPEYPDLDAMYEQHDPRLVTMEEMATWR